MEMNTLSKIVNESSDNSSEEDVDDYKEEYEKVTDLFYHCAHHLGEFSIGSYLKVKF